MKVKIINNSNNPLPAFQTKGAAGLDIQSSIDAIVCPGENVLINTGIYLEIPEGYECQVRSRSGLAYNGIVVANSPGTIDSDYRGEVKVILRNETNIDFIVTEGSRIAQLIFNKVEQPELELVTALSVTDRNEGGFGSTGK